jgi:hypothetical protein
MIKAPTVLDSGQRQDQSVSFDPIGYDPSEWEELFNDIDAALERESLPSLHGERWQPLEFGFEFTGPIDEVIRIKSVLDQFAMRVYLDDAAPLRLPPFANIEDQDAG